MKRYVNTKQLDERLHLLTEKLVSNGYRVFVARKDYTLQHVDILVRDKYDYPMGYFEIALYDDNKWHNFHGAILNLPDQFTRVKDIIEGELE